MLDDRYTVKSVPLTAKMVSEEVSIMVSVNGSAPAIKWSGSPSRISMEDRTGKCPRQDQLFIAAYETVENISSIKLTPVSSRATRPGTVKNSPESGDKAKSMRAASDTRQLFVATDHNDLSWEEECRASVAGERERQGRIHFRGDRAKRQIYRDTHDRDRNIPVRIKCNFDRRDVTRDAVGTAARRQVD